MEIKDTKQLDFLIVLDKITNEYKQNSFIDTSKGKLYIPEIIVNQRLQINHKEICDNRIELINNGYIIELNDEEDGILSLITEKGKKYLCIYGLG